MTGYSDRLNHALAYAAKHHDQQVRKGLSLPYLTAPASLALILTRYGRDEETVMAGILHGTVEDCLREGHGEDAIVARMADKFGEEVMRVVLTASRRRHDDDGVELSHEDQKQDLLDRLGAADDRSRWVCAAVGVHDGSSILTDLRRTAFPESVWSRFADGREARVRWYRSIHDRLTATGFDGEILNELDQVAAELERRGAE